MTGVESGWMRDIFEQYQQKHGQIEEALPKKENLDDSNLGEETVSYLHEAERVLSNPVEESNDQDNSTAQNELRSISESKDLEEEEDDDDDDSSSFLNDSTILKTISKVALKHRRNLMRVSSSPSSPITKNAPKHGERNQLEVAKDKESHYEMEHEDEAYSGDASSSSFVIDSFSSFHSRVLTNPDRQRANSARKSRNPHLRNYIAEKEDGFFNEQNSEQEEIMRQTKFQIPPMQQIAPRNKEEHITSEHEENDTKIFNPAEKADRDQFIQKNGSPYLRTFSESKFSSVQKSNFLKTEDLDRESAVKGTHSESDQMQTNTRILHTESTEGDSTSFNNSQHYINESLEIESSMQFLEDQYPNELKTPKEKKPFLRKGSRKEPSAIHRIQRDKQKQKNNLSLTSNSKKKNYEQSMHEHLSFEDAITSKESKAWSSDNKTINSDVMKNCESLTSEKRPSTENNVEFPSRNGDEFSHHHLLPSPKVIKSKERISKEASEQITPNKSTIQTIPQSDNRKQKHLIPFSHSTSTKVPSSTKSSSKKTNNSKSRIALKDKSNEAEDFIDRINSSMNEEDLEQQRESIRQWLKKEKALLEQWMHSQKSLIQKEKNDSSQSTLLLRTQKQRLQENLDSTKRQYQQEKDAYKATIHKLKLDYDAMVGRFKSNTTRLKDQIKDKDDEIQLLKNDLKSKEEEVQDMKKRISSLEKRNAKEKKNSSSLNEEEKKKVKKDILSKCSSYDQERRPSKDFSIENCSSLSASPRKFKQNRNSSKDVSSNVTHYSNGTWKESDGNVTTLHFSNGDIKTTYKDSEIIVYYYFTSKTTQTTYPDGLQIFEFPNLQVEYHYPDGRKEIHFADDDNDSSYNEVNDSKLFSLS